jgi:hypothetical protein
MQKRQFLKRYREAAGERGANAAKDRVIVPVPEARELLIDTNGHRVPNDRCRAECTHELYEGRIGHNQSQRYGGNAKAPSPEFEGSPEQDQDWALDLGEISRAEGVHRTRRDSSH